MRVLSPGGTESNPRWMHFATEGWRNMSAAEFNARDDVPAGFRVDPSFFSSFDARSSVVMRDIGTYEYDAVAAMALALDRSSDPHNGALVRQAVLAREPLPYLSLVMRRAQSVPSAWSSWIALH